MMDLDRVNNYLARVGEKSKNHLSKPVGSRLKVGVNRAPPTLCWWCWTRKTTPWPARSRRPRFCGTAWWWTTPARCALYGRSRKSWRPPGHGAGQLRHRHARGHRSSVKTHQYVAEGAGLEVTNILDEPSAANAIYQIEDGVVVDIGGGTTGLAILKEGKVVQIEDEPTGGTHLTLVLSGNYHVSFEEAEAIKQDYKRHRNSPPRGAPRGGKDGHD